ncbi:hypothetical protein FSP39_000976 [Pinctada imbricata]|uniref:Uncharacterized protein n=1 Tax=Pinctada imbricata TaxID=66713 RepID=A0AA88Y4B1_PINIB|nr:hypothetical protein FSP39_000976 [Pinctada imbricata]
MQDSRKRAYPEYPKGSKLSGPQQLKSDLTDWVQDIDPGWEIHQITSARNVINKLTDALWYIDHNHDKFKDAGCPIPKVFSTFQEYNQFKLQRRRAPTINGEKLTQICSDLSVCLSYPCMSSKCHKTLYSHIESLLQALIKYRDRLAKDNTRHKEIYHERREPSVSLETDSTSLYIPPVSFVKEPYRLLDSRLQSLDDYDFVDLDQFSPREKENRRKFIKEIHVSQPIMLFRVCYGGSIGTLNFVWSVPEQEQVQDRTDKNCKVIADISSTLPKFSSRAMRRDFLDKYTQYVKAPKSVLRHMYSDLTGCEPASTNEKEKELDCRVVSILLGKNDPDILLDYRKLNGRSLDESFNDFFLEVGKFFEEQILSVHERRHGDEMYLPLAISMEDLKESIVKRLPPGTPIPSTETLRLQFSPSNPFAKTAMKYTGLFNVKFRVQTRQARSHHPDAHYAACIFKYMKNLCVKYREDAMFVCMDDKAIVPVGEPGIPISTGVRAHNKVLCSNEVPLTCMDHDFHKSGVVPSVTLVTDIPECSEDSFFSGNVFVGCKDKIFEPSHPFRHSTELIKTLRLHYSFDEVTLCKSILCMMTDGGPDHRLTYDSVKASLVQLFMQLDLDFLVAIRTAPNHSWVNPAERCMSILNLCLQHVALSREEMDPKFERIMKQKNSINGVRNAAELKPELKTAYLESMNPVLDLLVERFKRMKLKGNQFLAYRGVSYEEMEECIDLVRNSCHLPQESREKLVPTASAKVIKDIKELQDFIKIHGRSTQYSFQLKKCTDDSNCSYCQINPVRMDKETFQSLSFLPCPVPDKDQQNHYQTFDQVYGNEVDDSHRPSRNSSGCFPDELEEQDRQHRDIFKTQKARDVVKCMDCLKPRLVFCNSKLSPSQEEILNQMTLDYICGDGTPEDSGLFMRRCITCSSDIEVSYYSAGLRTYLPPICIYCGSDDKLLDDNDPYIQDLHEKYSVVRPLCTICHSNGKDGKTWGCKFFKKPRNN